MKAREALESVARVPLEERSHVLLERYLLARDAAEDELVEQDANPNRDQTVFVHREVASVHAPLVGDADQRPVERVRPVVVWTRERLRAVTARTGDDW